MAGFELLDIQQPLLIFVGLSRFNPVAQSFPVDDPLGQNLVNPRNIFATKRYGLPEPGMKDLGVQNVISGAESGGHHWFC